MQLPREQCLVRVHKSFNIHLKSSRKTHNKTCSKSFSKNSASVKRSSLTTGEPQDPHFQHRLIWLVVLQGGETWYSMAQSMHHAVTNDTSQQVFYWCMKVEPDHRNPGRIWNISISVFCFFLPITCRRLQLCLWFRSAKCHPLCLSLFICTGWEGGGSSDLHPGAKNDSSNPHPRHEIITQHQKPTFPLVLRSQEKEDWWLDKWRELRKPFTCFCFWLSLFSQRRRAIVPPNQSMVSERLMTWLDIFLECVA